jgi:hypothetical protein
MLMYTLSCSINLLIELALETTGPFGRASAVAKTAVVVATLIKWVLW